MTAERMQWLERHVSWQESMLRQAAAMLDISPMWADEIPGIEGEHKSAIILWSDVLTAIDKLITGRDDALQEAYGKGYDAGVVDGAEDARQEGS